MLDKVVPLDDVVERLVHDIRVRQLEKQLEDRDREVRKLKRKRTDLKTKLKSARARNAALRKMVVLLGCAVLAAVQAAVAVVTWDELNSFLRVLAATPVPVLLLLPFCRAPVRHVAAAVVRLMESSAGRQR